MSEKLKDTAIDLLLDGVKKKIDDMRDNHKWQELFVNTGHFFINNSDISLDDTFFVTICVILGKNTLEIAVEKLI